jgi:hypothetical protein
METGVGKSVMGLFGGGVYRELLRGIMRGNLSGIWKEGLEKV